MSAYLQKAQAHTSSDHYLLIVLHVELPDKDPWEGGKEKVNDNTADCDVSIRG